MVAGVLPVRPRSAAAAHPGLRDSRAARGGQGARRRPADSACRAGSAGAGGGRPQRWAYGRPLLPGLVPAVLAFLKSTQNRTSPNLGLRGGIKGSAPGSGEYGRYEVLNWATKFFTDALIRHECIVTGTASHVFADYPLA